MKKPLLLSVSILLVTLSLFALPGCDDDAEILVQLIRDMVQFDRAYIPALALTSQHKEQEAKIAMDILKGEWRAFDDTYTPLFETYEHYRRLRENVSAAIAAADRIIQSDGDLAQAHEELEAVRLLFLKARKAEGIEYFLDYLTEFHEPMESVVLACKGKTPPDLSADDITAIKGHFAQAQTKWAAVKEAVYNPEEAVFNAALYRLDAKKHETFKAEMQLETEALKHLQHALESDDKKALLQAGPAIKPHFAAIYMLFGDFERVQRAEEK